MQQINYQSVDTKLAKIETVLNKVDWIPYISTLSGVVRILAAEVQIVAGLSFAAMKVLNALLKDSTYEFKKSWNGIAYALHGGANMLRGAIAVFPFYNLLLLAYDGFIGRMNYRYEKLDHRVYPLNQHYI